MYTHKKQARKKHVQTNSDKINLKYLDGMTRECYKVFQGIAWIHIEWSMTIISN